MKRRKKVSGKGERNKKKELRGFWKMDFLFFFARRWTLSQLLRFLSLSPLAYLTRYKVPVPCPLDRRGNGAKSLAPIIECVYQRDVLLHYLYCRYVYVSFVGLAFPAFNKTWLNYFWNYTKRITRILWIPTEGYFDATALYLHTHALTHIGCRHVT